MTELTEETLRAGLSDRGGQISPEAVARLQAFDYRPHHRRSRTVRFALTGTAAFVIVFVALLLTGIANHSGTGPAEPAPPVGTGPGPSLALASWTPVPSQPSANQLAAATAACNKAYSRTGPAAMTGTPVLAEQRKALTAAIYVSTHPVKTSYICMSNGTEGDTLLTSGTGLFTLYSPPGPNQLEYPDTSGGGLSGLGGKAPAGYGSLARARHFAPATDASHNSARIAAGLAGENITAVSFVFSNHVIVKATVKNGWYFAWWPGDALPSSATVASSPGTTTSSRMPWSKSCHDTSPCGAFNW